MKPFLIASLASLCIVSQPVHAATLTSLLAGGSLTEGDVQFSNFAFTDNVPFPPFPGDFVPDTDGIFLTTFATSSTATLKFDFDPAVAISGTDPNTDDEHLFDFFIDFDVVVTGGSSRTLTGLSFGDADLSASGMSAFAEIAFHDSLPIPVNPRAGSQVTDPWEFSNRSSLSLFGRIEGETATNGSAAGLSTFSLTFDLDGTPPVNPPATPIPLPASLPLILAGLGSLVFLRRRNQI